MTGKIRQIVFVAILLCFICLPLAPQAAAQDAPTQTNYAVEAQSLLAQMSVAERVGQLFLVTFQGDRALPGSEIAELITTYRIGGVVLLAENGNVTGYGNLDEAPMQVMELINALQGWALEGSGGWDLGETAVASDVTFPTPIPPETPIPLFVAVNHEGSPTQNSIRNGLTQIPTNMTIGATWRPAYAESVGEIVGRDLANLGVNMLLGPGLDVLENPSASNAADLGTRSFGGDPYWVGLMGRAYTTGVHRGSENRVAVIAKHFPGNGSSDRPIYQEVPTVRKSLEQLKQIELAPFFAVTSAASPPEAVADGLLTTHIRYQGFQGNIRATTVPISFDPQALTTLMALPEFTPWRSGGGIIVSDSLGARSVERFYDDTEQEFPHRRVAKDALLAGNDLLYLADFALGSGNYAQELANIQDTVLWFREKYLTDPPFQLRVDEAVLRILQLKLKLHEGSFAFEQAQRNVAEFTAVAPNTPPHPAILELTQNAITLISPSAGELLERLPVPPSASDQIIIFTDTRTVRQCSTCVSQPIISQTALEERMIALYGPNASGQVQPNRIRSFSFSELDAFLASGAGPILLPEDSSAEPVGENEILADELATPQPTPTPPPAYWVQEWLRDATWIILAVQGPSNESIPLQRLLAERTDLLRDRKIVVFTYDTPNFLDTTEISKLTAYYAVYNTTTAAIDASVRALFQEIPLNGRLPVSVSSIGYSLFSQTQPAPGQVIELFIVAPNGQVQSPPSEEPLDLSVGNTLRLQTGRILDRNGNRVPDGTVVQFILQDRVQGVISIIGERVTTNGVATIDYVLDARTGQFRITAVSGPAIQSQEVDIIIGDNARVAIITPTPAPTATPTPTYTPTPEPTVTPLPSATPQPTPALAPLTPPEPGVLISLSDFLLLLAMSLGLGITGVVAWAWGGKQAPPNKSTALRLRWLLWGIIGGLLVYIYFGLNLPGTAVLHNVGNWGGLLATLIGGLAGLLAFRVKREA